jgi:hypothetical protein
MSLLHYQRKQTGGARVGAWRAQNLWLPLTIIALGLACRLLWALSHSTDGVTRGIVVMSVVALATAFNTLVMLAGLSIASRLVDVDPAPAAASLIKLALLFVAGAAAGGFVASLDRFGVTGITIGVNAMILVYWILFALLFRTGLTETMMSVAIVGLIQAILNLGVWLL